MDVQLVTITLNRNNNGGNIRSDKCCEQRQGCERLMVTAVKIKSMTGRVIAGILLGCLVTTNVYADSKGDRESSRRGGNSDKAASTVRNATGGKVLGVRGKGRDDYDVRVLLPDGRVRSYRYDSRTGRVSD